MAKIINRNDSLRELPQHLILLWYYMANDRISNGENIRLVDMENALSYPDDLSDFVHPNSIGYDKMADVWFDAIIDIIPKLNAKVYLEGAYFERRFNDC